MEILNKKIILIFVLALAVVGSAVLIVSKRGEQTLNYESLEAARSEREAEVFKDSDNDGLKDWEEELWKTDPSNPDTDEDGTTDFEEIRAGRNPLVKGPDDKLDKETIAQKINRELELDLTETDKFSRELFARYIATKREGSSQKEDYQSLLYSYIQKVQDSEDLKIYNDEDFIITNNESVETVRKYGNELGRLIKENESKNKENENELLILERASKNSDEKELLKLEAPITRYKNLERGFLKTEAPASALPIHKEATNLFYILGESVEGMKFVFSDPVRALAVISSYPDTTQSLILALEDLRSYFLKKGIRFRSNEDGYIITGDI